MKICAFQWPVGHCGSWLAGVGVLLLGPGKVPLSCFLQNCNSIKLFIDWMS